jgi:hypothetical protein
VPVPEGFVEIREASGVGWVRSDLAELGADALWAEPEPLQAGRGRGGAGLLQLGTVTAVVRPFRRGGAFGRLLGDRYTGPNRVKRELELHCALRREGVPVVTPLAAMARKHRAFWRLRLLTEREPDALPLTLFCAEHPELRRRAVEAAAITVRLAFAAGLRHPDLHGDNVLVAARGDKVRAVLIDLDRATLKAPLGQGVQDAMLVRMARYLHRHAGRLVSRPSRVDRLRFLQGLGLDQPQRREAWVRLSRKLQRALAARVHYPKS